MSSLWEKFIGQFAHVESRRGGLCSQANIPLPSQESSVGLADNTTRNLENDGASKGKPSKKRNSQCRWTLFSRGTSAASLEEIVGREKALNPKRSSLTICADTLRYTSALFGLIGQPDTANEEKAKSHENPRSWTTRGRTQQTCLEPVLPEVCTTHRQPVLDVKIPSSPFLLPTTVSHMGVEKFANSGPPKNHRRGSLRSDMYWPSPASIALRLTSSPQVKDGYPQSSFKSELETPESLVEKSQGACLDGNGLGLNIGHTGGDCQLALRGNDSLERAAMERQTILEVHAARAVRASKFYTSPMPETPCRETQAELGHFPVAPYTGYSRKGLSEAATSPDCDGPDHNRLPSSSYEADEEDNSVGEPIPSIGSLKDHEAKKLDRTKRYTRIWASTPEDSSEDGVAGSSIRRYNIEAIGAGGERAEASYYFFQTLDGKKVCLRELRRSSDSPWKRTVRWADNFTTDNHLPNPSGDPSMCSLWNETLSYGGRVCEVDGATADLSKGFLELVSTIGDLRKDSRKYLPVPSPINSEDNSHGWHDLVNLFERPQVTDPAVCDMTTANPALQREFNAARLPLFTQAP